MPPINRRSLFVLLALLLLAGQLGYAQMPLAPEGVVFDDFVYASTAWGSELDGWDPAREGAGSLFGTNDWLTPAGHTFPSRMWYAYLWQEQRNFPEGTSIRVDSADGGRVDFITPAGSYAGHRRDGSVALEIVSGLTARRGTWAARVTFGDLEPARSADLIEGLFLQSVYGTLKDGTARWNEIDFEWNNRFRGLEQQHPFIATGYSTGQPPGAWPHRPLAAPLPDGSAPERPPAYTWSCSFTDAAETTTLDGAACTDVLLSRPPYPSSRPRSIVLVTRITDATVAFEVRADGPDGTLRARSDVAGPAPDLPLASLFAVYMLEPSVITEEETFSVDWFFYSPNTTLTPAAVVEQVGYLREELRAPRFSSLPGGMTPQSLERPYAHLAGATSYAGRTTPLRLDVSRNPTALVPGQSIEVLALPPLRTARYTFAWQVRHHFADGTVSPWRFLRSTEGGWNASFTLPDTPRTADIEAVEFGVLLRELDVEGAVIRNDLVRPAAARFTVDVVRD